METCAPGSQRLNVHGFGPQNRDMSVAEFRDSAAYSAQTPLPARKVAMPGVVRLAGSVIEIKSSGILDIDKIMGIASTDGLLGASVSGDGVPEGVTVSSIPVASVPGHPGTVCVSHMLPVTPVTGIAQPLTFGVKVLRSTISGLSSTDDLVNARVSGGGLPENSFVRGVRTPAVAATSLDPGVPGEVDIEAVSPDQKTVASLDPVDLSFDVPVAPVAIPQGVSHLIFLGADPVESVEVTFPANPIDGQLLFVHSARVISDLKMIDASKTIDPKAPAKTLAVAVGGVPGYIYMAPSATWVRIQ